MLYAFSKLWFVILHMHIKSCVYAHVHIYLNIHGMEIKVKHLGYKGSEKGSGESDEE